MPEIVIERPLPTPEASDALHEALKAALGDKCYGFRSGKGLIRVDLADHATPDDHNTATQIVLKHDFSKRAAHQIAHAERKEKLQAMRAEHKMRGGKLGAKADDVAALSKQVEWLLLEVEHLREQLGVRE